MTTPASPIFDNLYARYQQKTRVIMSRALRSRSMVDECQQRLWLKLWQQLQTGERISDPAVPITLVHASRGKYARAEPIAALYEQSRFHHVGMFAELEDELADWSPVSGARSPNRLDALVWAGSNLMLGPKPFEREVLRPR